jgi:prepilin-type N-terminal cleavage/methylation domain-containing protein
MARQVPPWLVRWLLVARRRNARSGFTLLELLVALLIGSIIVTALLYGLVEILQTNQRESSRAETQREMQLALDYISSDIRESVFVYDGACLQGSGGGCRGLLQHLPPEISSSGNKPILAMWRVDELPSRLIQNCKDNARAINEREDDLPAAIRRVPCLARRSYTLVVYYLDTTNTTGRWQGNARIRRYELSQFDARRSTQNSPAPNPGWVSPTARGITFQSWPFAGTNQQTQRPVLASGDAALVDFVDEPQQVNAASCPRDVNSPTPKNPAFVVSPQGGNSSFYACVRGGGSTQT